MFGGATEEDIMFEESNRLEASLDSTTHNILQQYQDPVEWKTELERVGPRLRANQQLATNEWRSHVDQTVSSKAQIEKVLDDTQGSLHGMNKLVASEYSKGAIPVFTSVRLLVDISPRS